MEPTIRSNYRGWQSQIVKLMPLELTIEIAQECHYPREACIQDVPQYLAPLFLSPLYCLFLLLLIEGGEGIYR